MTYTLNNKEVLVVDVPKNDYTKKYSICATNRQNTILYACDPGIDWGVPLPPGSWSILGLGSELTEEQCEPFVDKLDQIVVTYYKDYSEKGKVCFTSVQSFHSWLKSIGKEPETILVLINDK